MSYYQLYHRQKSLCQNELSEVAESLISLIVFAARAIISTPLSQQRNLAASWHLRGFDGLSAIGEIVSALSNATRRSGPILSREKCED